MTLLILVLVLATCLIAALLLSFSDYESYAWIPLSLSALLVLAAYFALRAPWRPYDPTWLVELAGEQFPDRPSLAEALAKCTRARDGGVVLHFVPSRRPNRPGSAWQFKESLILEHPTEGDLVVDILEGERVGAVEFISKLL